MPILVLTILKLALLLLLYVFVARAVRTVATDLHGPRRRSKAPPPRPAAAPAAPAKRNQRPPRQLVVHPPDGRPTVVTLAAETVTLGRSDTATVPVEDRYISDEHVQFSPDGEGWSVRDLGSTNGTYINGAKVTQAMPVAAGDQLRIGKTRIEARR